MKKYIVMAILGLLLGVTSPFPIWPGPLLLRHLPPGIISAVLIILACLEAMKEGSKIVGAIAIVYGVLAILAGATFTYVMFAVRSEELALSGIIGVGAAICLIVGEDGGSACHALDRHVAEGLVSEGEERVQGIRVEVY